MTTHRAETGTATTATITDTRRPTGPAHVLRVAAIVFQREVWRYTRQPVRIYGTVLGPLLIFVSFGVGLGHMLSQRMTGNFDFTSFLLPGMAGMAVILPAFGSAASIVRDREAGYLRDILVAPVSRFAVVLGKTLAGAVMGLLQGMIVLLLTPLIGITLTPWAVLHLVIATSVLGLGMCAGAVLVASRIRTIEAYGQLQNLVVNPLFFFSGATFPLVDLPLWLDIVTRVNPMTYAIDAMRRALPEAHQGIDLLTVAGHTVPVWMELGLVVALALAAMAGATRVFQRMT